MNKNFYLTVLLGASLAGCSGADKAPTPQKSEGSKPESVEIFSVADAKNNLSFSKNQYVKLINNVANDKDLHFSAACKENVTLCYPRAEEHNAIFMEQPKKWTNGFYPGLLWKLLASKEYISDFTDEQEVLISKTASTYQHGLISESKRNVTHDLGFILYDSFGEALEYSALSDSDRELYQQTLAVGRDTLSTRYYADKGVIKSWDWKPQYAERYLENGKKQVEKFSIAAPFDYPVIVDNMMNLEYLFAGNADKYNEIAFSHAEKTSLNHYWYSEDDVNKERPITYHLVDYGNMKPGNWQGVGAVSAWARGQGWSLYGFTNVVEAARRIQPESAQTAAFEKHLERLVESVSYFLKDGYVPDWDFVASRDDAYLLAENLDDSNTVYSKILDLCANDIPADILPYKGYRPMELPVSLLSDTTVAKLKTVTSVDGKPFFVGDKWYPCGTEDYDLTGREIPKDTSAAALMASALYQLASLTEDKVKRTKYATLADNIMAEITRNHLTSKDKSKSYDLGFVMANATGNLPSESEINTSIVYADFYFVEANIEKIALEEKYPTH